MVERRTLNSSGIKRKLISPVKNTEIHIERELSLEERLTKEVQFLKQKITDMELQNDLKDNEISNLQSLLTQSKFTVDKFKHNTAHFKFYCGFDSYEMFKVMLEYLQPAASSLIYWGSNTNVDNTIDDNNIKRGRSRKLSGGKVEMCISCRGSWY